MHAHVWTYGLCISPRKDIVIRGSGARTSHVVRLIADTSEETPVLYKIKGFHYIKKKKSFSAEELINSVLVAACV